MTQNFGFSSSLQANDNFGLGSGAGDITTIWDNALSYTLSSETPRDALSFGANGTLRLLGGEGQDDDAAELVSPLVSLSYARNAANSALDTQLRYSQLDLNLTDPGERIADDLASGSDDNLINDSGRRQTVVAGLGFETGLQSSLGLGLSLNYNAVTYTDVSDPALFDITALGVEGFARLRFSPVLSGQLTLSQEDFDAEDPGETRRTTRNARFGLQYALSQTTNVQAEIGASVIEERNDLVADTEETGATGSFGLTHALPRGQISVDLETALSVNGRRDRLSVSRSLTFPLGEVTATGGITRSPFDETDPFGSLSFSRETPRTTLTGQVERSFQTSIRGEETANTRAVIGYDVAINPVSSMSFGFDFSDVTTTGDAGTTARNVGAVTAAYNRSLTQDWGLSVGYEYTRAENNDDSVDTANEAFLTLSRDFAGR